VATINWDDPFIHSSDDDLYQIDQTQLHRNQFLMGATAYVLASLSEREIPLLAGETYSQGERRLANDVRCAVRVLEESAAVSDHGWSDVRALISQGVQREIRAVRSSAVFDTIGAEQSPTIIEALASRLGKKEPELLADLEAIYRQRYARAPETLPPDSLSIVASSKVPANPATLKEYFTNRGTVHAGGTLHSLMRDEVYNFVDGRRSYNEIYQAVRAEQLTAGSWYYGTVTLKDVVELLDAAVKAKALTLKH
jgi:hypothetical protein